jgi:hypothetical protein
MNAEVLIDIRPVGRVPSADDLKIVCTIKTDKINLMHRLV